MSGLNINLDNGAMQSIVAAAIMQHVGPEKRDEIMTAAVAYLLAPPAKTSHYGPEPKAPLQEAFERAAYVAAQDIIREEMAKPEYRDRLRAVVVEAMSLALDGDAKAATVRRMADALSAALVKE